MFRLRRSGYEDTLRFESNGLHRCVKQVTRWILIHFGVRAPTFSWRGEIDNHFFKLIKKHIFYHEKKKATYAENWVKRATRHVLNLYLNRFLINWMNIFFNFEKYSFFLDFFYHFLSRYLTFCVGTLLDFQNRWKMCFLINFKKWWSISPFRKKSARARQTISKFSA